MRNSGLFTGQSIGKLFPFIFLVFAPGCGDSNMAAVTGKVTCKGETVTGGTLMFLPVQTAGKAPGKGAVGGVKANGSYVLGTHAGSDGAVIGRHKVSYTGPFIEMPEGKKLEPGEIMPQSPFNGMVPKEEEVEVKPGSNTINIELVPPGQK